MKNPVKNLIWRTADGRDYQIRQMETSHIRNCVRAIYRHATFISSPLPGGEIDEFIIDWRVQYLPTLKSELERRI